MSSLKRATVQTWIEELSLESYVCDDCEAIHLAGWESKDGVLESRCFVEADRCSLLTEIAIRPSSVLPLQGAVHFMNYDYGLLKVMISMTDDDVPRLLLTHALPVAHLTADQFKHWLPQLFAEMEAVYQQLVDMEVLLIDDELFETGYDDSLH